ncbi:hypothetical protein niasHT_005194 [Heterodera trifolii]|uniref:PDZ domain-containing protein 8 n=1 Tax=Heterodera trifolii TaxID=157864 RepID=A0ABD2LRT3_9BILA
MSPQKTRIPNELKAFLHSCSVGVGSEWESCSSLSLLLHFLFQEHKDTRQFRRWFYKKLQLELNDVTARSSTAGRIIHGIQIRDLEAGMNSPVVNNVRVESFQLSEDDPDLFEELVLLLDVDYRGGFQMSVDANMAFGKFAQLSVKLLQLNGRARFSIRRQPFAHWSFSFVEAPQMDLKVDSQFQGRSLRHLIPLINSAFRKAIQLKHVWPNYKLRFRPFFQNPLYSPSPNTAAFEHVDLSGTGLEVTVLSASRLNLSGFGHSAKRLFCMVSIEKRPINPYQNSDQNTSEKLRRAAHLLSVLLQFTRKGAGGPLGLTFNANGKEPNSSNEVRVANVEPGSNAEKSGFRVGDTLVAVNNIPVRNERQATRLLTGTAGDLLVLVERELNESENGSEESADEETEDLNSATFSREIPTKDVDFICPNQRNFSPVDGRPIEYSAKDEIEGDEPSETFSQTVRPEDQIQTKPFESLRPFDDLKIYSGEEKKGQITISRKQFRSSERATKTKRTKKMRRSRSESEIRNVCFESAAGSIQTEENPLAGELINPYEDEHLGENSQIGIRRPKKHSTEKEGIVPENVTGEKGQKQSISRREKLHAKANEMAVRLSKSKLNEFIWSRRKPVEMAVEANDSNDGTEPSKNESDHLEKPRRKWTRKNSTSPHFGPKIEPKMANSQESAGPTESKCTKTVQITRNPIWGQSLHFGLNKDSLYLNVCLYATNNSQDEPQRNDGEELTMLGWTNVYVPGLVEDCSLTLSYCHRERFHLREPKSVCHSVPAEFDQLSRHNGFDRRLCFGDLLISFRFFPDGLPVELGECTSLSQSAPVHQTHQLDDPCQSLANFSHHEHRWVPLKHKQSFNVSCGVCGGKIWLKWANQCEKCDLVCHAKCLEGAQNKECQSTDPDTFDDDTFIELATDEIAERKRSNVSQSPADEQKPSPSEKCSDGKNASSNCRRRRIAERLQTFSALTLKSVQEYSRRRKGQSAENENSTSDIESPGSPKSPFSVGAEGSFGMVSIAEVLEMDLLDSLEGFGPKSQFSDLKFEPGNAYNPQVVCEAKVKGQRLFDWCETEERKKRINGQIDLVQAEIEAVTRLRRSLPNKSGVAFERIEHRLQALAFIMMLYCYALNDCHEKEEGTKKNEAAM